MDIGFLGIILIVTAVLEFNPILQAWRMIKTKSVRDVSWKTFAIILTVGALWLYYGIDIKSWPLIIANAIKLFPNLSGFLFFLNKQYLG